MLKLTRQNLGPVKTNYKGLGQVNTITTDAGLVSSIVSAFGKLFGGQSHPWIPAQNNAESQIAAIVAAYVTMKNSGSLTQNYIATAMSNVAAISKAFSQYAATFNTAAANNGASDIANNANAVIQNMEADLAALPVNPISSLISSVLGTNPQSTVTSTITGAGSTINSITGGTSSITPTITPTVTAGLLSSLSTTSYLAIAGIAYFFFFRKK